MEIMEMDTGITCVYQKNKKMPVSTINNFES